MPEVIEKYYTPLNTAVGHYAKSLSAPALFNHIRGTTIVNGDVLRLNAKVRAFVEESVLICQPDRIHIVDGSERENNNLLKYLQEQGTITPLPKYENCWLARTNPADVARVESKTFICTEKREDAIPTPKEGVSGKLGNWISPKDYNQEIKNRFPGCMKGRTMYVIPFSMGPIGSPLSKVGIEVTDSPYVVCSMKIMTRMGSTVLDLINRDNLEFVRCLHSTGTPLNGKQAMDSWPCDPERTIILHKPDAYEIVSYGSGYGGNSLLGKKCFALRIGSVLAQKEGWLAEHMLILGVTCPNGQKKYIAAAFPSACGKTNLAMMAPSLPGYKMECVGDDIAWMKFDEHGQLRAINAERGFFGVAPGTSWKTNPSAMASITKNTIFTNVATTSDGGIFWEGLEDDLAPGIEVTDWLGNPWTKGVTKTPAAHPNSRFCAPCENCPVIDPSWEDPEGVVISAILFGGRRPIGVPLIHEALNWQHGVFMGSAMRSEATAAAEHKSKVIMNDPMAMRPFFGYNFSNYLRHWLSMEDRCDALDGIMPKIFFVNWFRKDENGRFLWPGYGDNSRVIDWILRRCDNEECYEKTPIGLIPSSNALRMDGMTDYVDLEKVFAIEKDFWIQEAEEIQQYFDDQVGDDLPSRIQFELDELKKRVEEME